ncbi:hypothetical protein I3I95_00880 [bacterium]|nr:hypothetical protein [bacterium]
MSAQWPLLIVALLTGVGGWLLAAACGHVLAGGAGARVRPRTPHVVALLAVVVLMVAAAVVQGVALGRASALFQLLARPGSSTFAPGVATIACLVLAAAVVVAGRRGVGDAPMRVLAAFGCVAGVALAVTGAASFLPSSFPAWNTPLLPLVLCGTEAAAGTAAFDALALLAGKPRANGRGLGLAGAFAIVGGALGLAGAVAYVAVTGLAGTSGGGLAAPMGVATIALAACALACAVAAWALRGRRRVAGALAVIATLLGLAACVTLRLYLGDFAVRKFNLVSSPLGRL